MMDAYEVHKKIQEAIIAVEIYNLKSSVKSSMWHAEIIKGLEKLAQERQLLSPSPRNAGHIRISQL